MKKNHSIILGFLLILTCSYGLSQTIVYDTEVQGFWTKASSPYIILRDITVPEDTSLIIEPGVEVEFAKGYGMQVKGNLLAIGEDDNKIVFTSADTISVKENITNGWKGISIDGENTDTSILQNCVIEYVYSGDNNYGQFQGAVNIYNRTAIIRNCKIHKNTGYYGGGIYCSDVADIIIQNCTIKNNKSQHYGGVFIRNSEAMLLNNLIANNGMNLIVIGSNQNSDTINIFNNTIVQTDVFSGSVWGGCMFMISNISVNICNTIIYGKYDKTLYEPEIIRISNSDYASFNNCIVEGGRKNIRIDNSRVEMNNLYDATPGFVDGTDNNYQLSDSSYGINSGNNYPAHILSFMPVDLAGNQRIYDDASDIIDVGAYEYQGNQLANRPPSINNPGTHHLLVSTSKEMRFSFSDVDPSDSHLLSISSDNPNITLGALSSQTNNAIYRITPMPGWSGTANIVLSVSDNHSARDIDTFTVEVSNSIDYNITENTVWDTDTVFIENYFSICAGATLEIRPGVNICFLDNHSIGVQGILKALGTPGNNIVFSSLDTSGFSRNAHKGWGGIVLWNETDSSVFSNCVFEYVKNKSVLTMNENTNADFVNCIFRKNMALTDYNNPSVIQGNKSALYIGNCLFYDNQSMYATIMMDEPQIIMCNSVFYNNKATFATTDLRYQGKALMKNCIFWNNNNRDWQIEALYLDSLDISNCFIEGGIPTISNYGTVSNVESLFDVYPKFNDPLNGNFHLTSNSPCINAGVNDFFLSKLEDMDMEGNNRIYGDAVALPDIGPYEYQGEPSNRQPVLEKIEDKTSMLGKPLHGKVNFFDADEGNTHTLYVTSDNANITVQGLSGDTTGSTYSLVPATGYSGDAVISVVVEDNGGLYDSISYNLHVEQNACGNIYEDMVWDEDTIIVNCDVTVNPGATLTINPGTIVIFNGPYKLTVNGSINACGIGDLKIVFTDINNLWQGIEIYPFKEQDTSQLRNCEISHAQNGGISVNYNYYNTVIVSDCYIHHNYNNNSGGGIYNLNGPVLIENCNISYNTSNQSGGGIFAYGSGNIIHNTISNNTSRQDGGGIYSDTYYSSGSVIEGNIIQENRSSESGGGGIYARGGYKIKDNIIRNNFANTGGGGIKSYENCTLLNNRIESNSCNETGIGGAIYLYAGNFNVINNLIINNHTGSGSPGVFLSSVEGLFANNTICNNTSISNGKGIYFYGDKAPSLVNNIFWGNGTTGSKVQLYISNELSQPTIKNCIIEGGKDQINCSAGIYFTNDFKENIDIYPGFTDTVNNDYSLSDNSIAINSGCADITGLNIPETDIEGNARIYNGNIVRIDIGAYEYVGEPANRRPILKEVKDISLFSSQSKKMTVEFLDTDLGDAHTITVESDQPNLSVENLSGNTTGSMYDIVAAQGWYGLANMKIRVEDSQGLADSVYYSVLVSDSICGTLTQNAVWDRDTVYVTCDILVPEKNTLTIMAGTRVIFTGPYKINVNGTLKAVGTELDRIIFESCDTSASNSGNFWRGIYLDQSLYNSDTSLILFCNFQYGRNIEIRRDNVIVSNCIFNKCRSLNGGGIVIYNSSPLIENNIFSHNQATYTGGGISCMDEDDFDSYDTKPVISGNVFCFNQATHGGAIYSAGTHTVIYNNEIYHNHANYGGALYFYYRSRYSPIIHNNLIYKNNATYEGGAIVYDDCRTPYQVNNTIVKNEAGKGGGLYVLSYANPQIYNDIIFYNSARQDGNQVFLYGNGSSPYIYNCFLQYGFDSIAGSGSGTEYRGVFKNVLTEEPLFADTTNHNYQLSDSSYCINAGTFNIRGMPLPEKDIAGNSRVFAGPLANIDIGAYEFQGNPVNRKPIIIHSNDQYTYISERKRLRVFYTDVDKSDTHTITITTDNSNVIFENKSGDISGSSYELVPAAGWQGISEIYVRVEDDKGNFSIDTFNLIVSEYYCGSITENTTWDRDTIKVLCDIIVEKNATLTIMPGTVVSFEDHLQLKVLGRLLALGTNKERITFTASDKSQYPGENYKGWRGIRFFGPNNSEGSRLEYCIIEYAKGANHGFPFDNYGGGLYIDEWSDILISNCIISNNSAVERGGGIYCYSSGAKIVNSKISNNQAGFYGGGLFIKGGGYPYTYLINSIVCNNESEYEGGGINIENLYSFNNVIANNKAVQRGGGVYISSVGYLYNTIIWGNTAANYPQMCQSYSASSYLYNNVLQGGLSNMGYSSTSVKAYENMIEQNPQFILPSQGTGIDYDGVSADWSIIASSPCINKGTDDISIYWYESPVNDINGENRVLLDTIDIGAYEFRNSEPVKAYDIPFQRAIVSIPANINVSLQNAFIDNNIGDRLTYNVPETGKPQWVETSITGDFIHVSGTPAASNIDINRISVIATDRFNTSDSNTLIIVVYNNTPPEIQNKLPDMILYVSENWNYLIPENCFIDNDTGDVLNYSVKQINGNVLPDWLSFDTINGIFTGIPQIEDTGALSIIVRAFDLARNSVADTFNITVEGSNAINEIGDGSCKIYPVPAHDVLNIEFIRIEDFAGSVDLIGIDGKILELRKVINNNIIQIDVSKIPSGIYHLRLKTGKGYIQYKVFIW
ncbi:MAG: right-handed parallel beta-helix repeat-containing protein [Bacteroidales bacterium]|nr:right-handed parallel beta-helix repeat-containing protein [Bacteroidales bacterium]